jgi:hypothetical protein
MASLYPHAADGIPGFLPSNAKDKELSQFE